MSLSISQVAARTGLTPDALRYYEREGLLPEADRDHAGRRRYPDAALAQLEVVLALRGAGFGVREIATFLTEARQGEAVGERLEAASVALDRIEQSLQERAAQVRRAQGLVCAWREEVTQASAERDAESLACAPGAGTASAPVPSAPALSHG